MEIESVAGRPLMLATLLGASIGVPYVVSRSGQSPTTAQSPIAAQPTSWPSWGGSTNSTNSPPPLLPPVTSQSTTPSYPAPPPAYPTYPTTSTPAAFASLDALRPGGSARFHSIQEVFRFNLTKEWVYQNWDRKSTGLGDPEFFGIRVALVTGTQRTDLAGSLTYLFDGNGQLQHISFRGRTADTTPLVQFVTQTYQLERKDAPPGEQLYQVRSGQNVYSELRTSPESVLLEAAPQGSFGVVLELGRPGSNRALKPAVPPLDIPPAPEPPPAATAKADADGDGKPDENAQPGLVGKFRPATQSEHNQVFEHRWPN